MNYARRRLTLLSVFFLFLANTSACGATQSPPPSQLDASESGAGANEAGAPLDRADASSARLDASQVDATAASRDGALDSQVALRCGSASCGSDEICVIPACGCFGALPEADGGCRADWLLVPPGKCVPRCPVREPYCVKPTRERGDLMCTGVEGSLKGSVVETPAADASHVCYESCV